MDPIPYIINTKYFDDKDAEEELSLLETLHLSRRLS